MKLIKTTKSPYSKVKSIRLNSPLISRILLVAIFLVILTILKINIKLILFLIAAIFFNAILQSFQLKRGLPTDFELSTFATVLVTMAFGIQWGIFIAIFSKLVASIYTGNLVADHFFMIATYIVAAVITAIVGGNNVILLGLIVVLIDCILMFMISKNMLGIDITANLAYTGTNFIFNSIVFLSLGEVMLMILRS